MDWTNSFQPLDKAHLESASSLVIHFYENLVREIERHRRVGKPLTIEENELFRHYYREHCLNSKSSCYVSYSLAALLAPMVKLIGDRSKPVRVLDAGCGLGTESILFALLGANVVGIDIARERIVIAQKRLAYYEDIFGRMLPVSFRLQNILTFSDDEKFDIVWNSQSISHIHPAEMYFRLVYNSLKNGGHFVIYESNGLNPYISFFTWLVHLQKGSRTTTVDPTTGELVSYAIERTFNARQLARILGGIGFTIERVEYYNFVPRRLNISRGFRDFNRLMNRIPIVRAIGASYVVVARK